MNFRRSMLGPSEMVGAELCTAMPSWIALATSAWITVGWVSFTVVTSWLIAVICERSSAIVRSCLRMVSCWADTCCCKASSFFRISASWSLSAAPRPRAAERNATPRMRGVVLIRVVSFHYCSTVGQKRRVLRNWQIPPRRSSRAQAARRLGAQRCRQRPFEQTPCHVKGGREGDRVGTVFGVGLEVCFSQ